ncbi:hypothetical protein N9H57_02835 [Flavobacteriaceae bacterium]|nr:hypothetical protein [Flavobacteriaceae bacterium]MDA8948053.1 hypothetical protein [Flavobacteriaceae bacterium]MDA9572251.1 hypothetical protein [Flavobacteriaceae bacterium]
MDKKDFDALSDSEKIDALFDMVKDLQDKKTLTREQRLQRKSLWSKQDVCFYFGISTKTFERWKIEGEINVKQMRGKDYVKIIDLKRRLMDRGEDIEWLLKHMP